MATSESRLCPQCGAPIDLNVLVCKYCGASISAAPQYQTQQAPQYTAPLGTTYTAVASAKSKTTAGILALLLGGLGAHKFYLGKPGLGILYLLFCWTYVPSILGLIEGIVYLSASDAVFQAKYVKH